MHIHNVNVPDIQLKIKICGLKTASLIDVAIDAGADYVGLNNFSKSPRYLNLHDIATLINHIGNRAQSVVLLVDPDNETIQAVDALRPHFIQLHGSETVERVRQIRQIANSGLIKALPVETRADVERLVDYDRIVDFVLLDAKPPPGSDIPGGNGNMFDWILLKGIDPAIRFMLSGGLNVENVASAVSEVRPFGIDVSSGVERVRGEKDAGAIRRFISRATIASI